jgi:hypothetical protein
MALKRISMAGSDVVVTDGELADLVQEYAMELGRVGTTDIVTVPDVREGHATQTRLLVGPASQIAVSENDDAGLDQIAPQLIDDATARVRLAIDRITGRVGGAVAEEPLTPTEAFPDFDSYSE